MILKIKPCCPVSDIMFRLELAPQLDKDGDQKPYECRVVVKYGDYIAQYCLMCGTKIEIGVIE